MVATLVACASAGGDRMTRAEYFATGNELCQQAAVAAAELDFTSVRTETQLVQAGIDLGVLRSDASLALVALHPPEELDVQHQELAVLYD